MGVILTAALSLFIANTISLTQISIIGSASFLLVFFIVNVAAYRLSEQIGANKVVVILASIVSFTALVTLLVHTYESNATAIAIFIAFILASIFFEMLYGRLVRKHFFYRAYTNNET